MKHFVLILMLAFCTGLSAENSAEVVPEPLDVKEFILEHLADSYEWHIVSWGDTHLTISLPVIIYSKLSGWHFFISSTFDKHPVYYGLSIAKEGKYKGKIVEIRGDGSFHRPLDLSITKVVLSIFLNSLLLIIIVLSLARSYRKAGIQPQKGFNGMMEMFIMNVTDEMIKPCIGPDYKRFVPYLLTVFFFIFLNNLMGLVPFIPGGVNVTGNIAITFVLAVFTFLVVNGSGSREYWREIFWPDVPLLLKVPFPLMPIIEIVGLITKPFALMIRLFANILAGHSIVLGLTSLIFITVKMGPIMNAQMTVISVIFSVFMIIVELLVAYIQAYVFTMLSAVFIGLARVRPHHEDVH